MDEIIKHPAEQQKCQTCGGQGMIGGPSYSAPDEGGEPCPDCAAEQQEGGMVLRGDGYTFDPERLRAIAVSGSMTAMSGALENIARALRNIDSEQQEGGEAVKRDAAILAVVRAVDDALTNYERQGEICPFEGNPMIYAETLVELGELARVAMKSEGQK